MVDAISRTVQKQMKKTADEGSQYPVDTEVYLRRFAIVLKDDALQGCFVPCSSKDKVGIIIDDDIDWRKEWQPSLDSLSATHDTHMKKKNDGSMDNSTNILALCIQDVACLEYIPVQRYM